MELMKKSNRITPTHRSLWSVSWNWLCVNGAARETKAGGVGGKWFDFNFQLSTYVAAQLNLGPPKVCGCYLICFYVQLLPIRFAQQKLNCTTQIYDEGTPLISLWSFIWSAWLFILYWIHMPFQLCSPLSVDYTIKFDDVFQSLLNMCLYDVCSLILT